ncbi:hypothetical protein, partial [Endozoicomonas sp. ONNA2]|uniref:hypothetical protein n=1 Tax=Endozoicomonas sp. ONNA2 TaxID=2828741 RepID=UPI002147D893
NPRYGDAQSGAILGQPPGWQRLILELSNTGSQSVNRHLELEGGAIADAVFAGRNEHSTQ